MPVVLLASFPNSRIKTRKPTTVADTLGFTLPTGVVTPIIAADANRTYLTVRNTDLLNDVVYGYRNTITQGTGLATDGFLIKAGESVDIDSPQQIFALQSSGGNILLTLDRGQG